MVQKMYKSFNFIIWHRSVIMNWCQYGNCLTHFVLTQVLRMLAFLLDQWKVCKYLIVILWFTFYVSNIFTGLLDSFFVFCLGCSWLVWIFKFSGFCFIMFLVVQKKEIKKEIAHHFVAWDMHVHMLIVVGILVYNKIWLYIGWNRQWPLRSSGIS